MTLIGDVFQQARHSQSADFDVFRHPFLLHHFSAAAATSATGLRTAAFVMHGVKCSLQHDASEDSNLNERFLRGAGVIPGPFHPSLQAGPVCPIWLQSAA